MKHVSGISVTSPGVLWGKQAYLEDGRHESANQSRTVSQCGTEVWHRREG